MKPNKIILEGVREPRDFVIIESPYAGDVDRNVAYAKRAMKDSLDRGEAPFASHLLYTDILDDTIPEEREIGIEAGLDIGRFAVRTAVYTDHGISRGMGYGIRHAEQHGRPIGYRTINQPEGE